MNWAQLRQLYIGACAGALAATAEWDIHLTEGYRVVAGRLNVEELDWRGQINTVVGQDWVTLPADVYHVIAVWDRTNALKLQQEPGGMRGRSRYVGPTLPGSPASGKPTYYVSSGDRIYLRDTPDGIYELDVLARLKPSPVTEAALGDGPVTPEEYDMAIVYAAALNYMSVHPDSDVAGDSGEKPSAAFERHVERALKQPDSPKDRERMDQSGRMYPRGFSMRR